MTHSNRRAPTRRRARLASFAKLSLKIMVFVGAFLFVFFSASVVECVGGFNSDYGYSCVTTVEVGWPRTYMRSTVVDRSLRFALKDPSPLETRYWLGDKVVLPAALAVNSTIFLSVGIFLWPATLRCLGFAAWFTRTIAASIVVMALLFDLGYGCVHSLDDTRVAVALQTLGAHVDLRPGGPVVLQRVGLASALPDSMTTAVRTVYVGPSPRFDDVAAHIIKLSSLEYLECEGQPIGSETINKILRSHIGRKLRELRLAETRIDDKLDLSPCQNLEYVSLRDTAASDRTILSMANLKHLRSLDLSNSAVSFRSAEVVAHLPRLEWVDISGCSNAEAWISQLKRSHVHCVSDHNGDYSAQIRNILDEITRDVESAETEKANMDKRSSDRSDRMTNGKGQDRSP